MRFFFLIYGENTIATASGLPTFGYMTTRILSFDGVLILIQDNFILLMASDGVYLMEMGNWLP